jgi:hypothetical protein
VYLADENNLWLKSDLDVSNGTIKASRFLLQPSAFNTPEDIVYVVRYLRNFFRDHFTQYEVHLVNSAFIRVGESVSQTCHQSFMVE